MKTTLNKVRAQGPCVEGWQKLLRALNKVEADDESVSISFIVDSNGVDDAIWCLRAVDGRDKEIRLFAVWCARQVQHLMKDPRSLRALDVAEAYAHGQATLGELNDAYADAARAAHDAYDYADDARAADAAYAATYAAAYDAYAAAYGVADTVADAADAATYDAYDAARKAQADELKRVCAIVEGEAP